jgi:hypothetical protein
MIFSSLRKQIEHVRRKAYILAHFNPSFHRRVADSRQDRFITCSGKIGGVGSQVLAVLSGMLFARDMGLKYVHSPFKQIQHNTDNDSSWEAKWEKFFNLGKDELSVDEISISTENYVYLESLADTSLNMTNTLYILRHCHEYANLFPNRYSYLTDRLVDKYFSSSKTAFQSYYDRSKINVAIHVRRGDVLPHGNNASRHTANQFICSVVEDVLSAISNLPLTPSLCLYSEGKAAEFGPLQDMGIHFYLNECPFSAFHNLVSADVLVMSKSAFSYSAALFSQGIKVYESFKNSPFYHRPLDDWLIADKSGRIDINRLLQKLRNSQLVKNLYAEFR